MARYPLILLISLAACFGAQTLALKLVGGKTRKSESNYFSSIARLQTETKDRPRVLFLGSSLTGRLPERPQAGNLGCDGASAVITLRAIDEGLLPSAEVIFVETNTLSYELESLGRETAAALRSDWFKAGMKVPNLGATARPTAFAYSWLESRRNRADAQEAGQLSPFAASAGFSILDAVPDLQDAREEALVDEISGILSRLKYHGADVRLVLLPAGGKETELDLRIARAVAAKTRLPWWDMTAGIPAEAIGYTDGRHMDAAAAAAVVDALLGK
ncbi:MAG: hypothetical protein EOP87_11710 [Verrucomicrobiaceae bacterium]|nr:MAG: hypothetical protein EOP87_11710 [Verrucomicrobiaceae bacterium]